MFYKHPECDLQDSLVVLVYSLVIQLSLLNTINSSLVLVLINSRKLGLACSIRERLKNNGETGIVYEITPQTRLRSKVFSLEKTLVLTLLWKGVRF